MLEASVRIWGFRLAPRIALVLCLLPVVHLCVAPPAHAACVAISDGPELAISRDNLDSLSAMGIGRHDLFLALRDTARAETDGCWAGATGNFDDQIVSVGALQWNFGQDSLQPILRRFRAKFATQETFEKALATLMPTYGSLAFSTECLATPIGSHCRLKWDELQDKKGNLEPNLKLEMDSLFNSTPMLQVQLDEFARLVTSVKDDLLRLFGPENISALKIKWAIDTKVQQGRFPTDNSVRRMRERSAGLSLDRQRAILLSIVQWYSGLCGSLDQDGTRLDYQYNTQAWTYSLNRGFTPEQFELLYLTFLRSRTSAVEEGRWQALTFQRRATIILGAGSVAGRRFAAK